MMHPCASAAKLRGGGPILHNGMTAMVYAGPRHLELSSATSHCGVARAETVSRLAIGESVALIRLGAWRPPPAPHPPAPTATGQSAACGPRPRSWSCGSWAHSRYAGDTIALVLLRHDFLRLFGAVVDAWQQGHLGSRFAMPMMMRRRIVAMEFGTWRSGRSGRAPRAPTFG